MDRRIKPVIFVIDTSQSMAGPRIVAVNQFMREAYVVLREVFEGNPEKELRVAVLQFSDGANWVIGESELITLEDFYLEDLTAGGRSNLDLALNKLDLKLSSEEFLIHEGSHKRPVLIFISDGCPSDDYKLALKNISDTNVLFNNSQIICLTIDDDLNIEVPADIVGRVNKNLGKKCVIKASDPVTLKKLIKTSSVSVALTGEKDRTDSNLLRSQMKEIREEMTDAFGIR